MRPGRTSPVLLVLLRLLAGCGGGASSGSPAAAQPTVLPATLQVGLIPTVAPDGQRATYAPFGEALGVKVELFLAPSYAGVVTALAAGQLGVAYLGGLTYVQADKQVPLTPLVIEVDREAHTPRYLSAVVVRPPPQRGR